MSLVRVATIAAALSMIPGTAVHADPAREVAVSALMDKAAASPTALRVFLQPMPKGGDLHNHLGGSVYAEDWLRWAAAEGYCLDVSGLGVVPSPCPAEKALKVVAANDWIAYDRLVDSLSTRGLQSGVGRNDTSGHTQFFASFDKLPSLSDGGAARELVATKRLAAGDRVSYLELDHNTAALTSYTLAAPDVPLDEAGLPARYAEEVSKISPVLDKAVAELDRNEAEVSRSMGCAGPKPETGCGVTVHYLFQALRGLPPAQVFRSLILGFAMAERDKRFVGVNIVMPEDGFVSLRDYDLHMAMFRFLEAKYPSVHRTLHAGELAFGQVPAQDMKDHIAKAIASGAERIGHGTGIAYEDNARATMARMARAGIAVEINLTSNDVILGVKGADHPLSLYRSMGVPVVLSTDDEGVLRTDMTNEYVRAVREQGLRYGDLKEVARASLEYAFLPGKSLWVGRKLGTPVTQCAASLAAPPCRDMLARSEKARLEAELEGAFDRFEQSILADQEIVVR